VCVCVCVYIYIYIYIWGYATSRKDADSIPDGVSKILNLLIKSLGPHCGPGVDSASKRNDYQEYFLGGKSGRCVEFTNHFHTPTEPETPGAQGPVQACNETALPF
jgi:hypothetical protein